MELDHVLIAAPVDTGLESIAGGRHPAWGTANRIVPLGRTYLELVTVAEERAASASAFGRWVMAARAGAPFGWAVRTPDLDADAARLGLAVHQGSRLATDGRELTWRMAGVERAAAEPALPFLIEWGPQTPFPGASGPQLEVSLELRGDPRHVSEWLRGHRLPVTVAPGEPAVVSVTVGGRRIVAR